MSDNKRKLTIGVIQQTPDLGGAETYMAALMGQFVHTGHTVLFATNNEKFFHYVDEPRIKKFKIPLIIDFMGNIRGLIKSTALLPFAFVYYLQLLFIFKRQHVQVIVMSGFSEKMLVSFLSLFFHIPVIWIEYGRLDIIFRRLFGLPKLLYLLHKSIPKKIISASQFSRSYIIKDASLNPNEVAYIPCGTVITKSTANRKKLLPGLEKAFIIGNVSRMTTEKGQQVIISAMPEILKKVPNARLLIIGSGDSSYFQELAKKLEVNSAVTFTGFVENLQDYYAAMDLFVFPTVWELEGFGLVTIEAMTHKLAVVASDIGPVPEIVVHEKTGILVPPGDTSALANAIIALANDEQKRKTYGENGFKRVKDAFMLEQASKKYIDVFHKVVSNI